MYSVLHYTHNAITVLNSKGRQDRILLFKEAFGNIIKIGWDILMDSNTHHIYVPCEDENSGKLGVSLEGEALWFVPVSSDPWGITEIDNLLCVVGVKERCVHLVAMSGQYTGKLLGVNQILGEPKKIFYDKSDKKLYITFQYISAVSIFSVET